MILSYKGQEPQQLTKDDFGGKRIPLQDLNNLGWYRAVIDNSTGQPLWYQDRQFDTPTFDDQTNVYTFTYTVVDKPLVEVKQLAIAALRTQRDNYIDNQFGNDEDSTLQLLRLYKAVGTLVNIIKNAANIKNAVTNNTLLNNIETLATDLDSKNDIYKTKLAAIRNATTVAEILAI